MGKKTTSSKKLQKEANKRTRAKKPIGRIALLQASKIALMTFATMFITLMTFTYIIPFVTSYFCNIGPVSGEADFRVLVNGWLFPSLGFTIMLSLLMMKALILLNKKINKCFNNIIDNLKEKYGITEEDDEL